MRTLASRAIGCAGASDAPSSTKNRRRARALRYQTKKGKQWSGCPGGGRRVLAHSLTTTAANASDVTQAGALLRR